MNKDILLAYIKSEFEKNNTSFDIPVSEDLLIQLVGTLGLDILKQAEYIEPGEYPGTYNWCEMRNRVNPELLRAFDYTCPLCKKRRATELDGGWSPTKFGVYRFAYTCDDCGFLCVRDVKMRANPRLPNDIVI